VSQYASAAELLALGLPAEALSDADPDAYLRQASGLIDSYLTGRYKLPLQGSLGNPSTFPAPLPAAAIAIAAWEILTTKGFNPDQYDENYRVRRNFYLGDPERGTKGWLDKLAAGAVSISAALDATPTVYEGAAVVATGSARGWDESSLNSVGEPIGNFWGAPKF
jgi:phage gp36-like protein